LSRPDESSSSRRHRVNAIDARIRPFIFESQQRCRATSARARSLDERVIYFFLFFFSPRRRTRRDGPAASTRARRARDATTRRWMMNRRDRATTDRAIDDLRDDAMME